MPAQQLCPVEIAARKWSKKRGSLIMMLHEIQNQLGYVPRAEALALAQRVEVPVARIYEVLTFYNYFKLESPGRAVISVCTGTACYLAGADRLIESFSDELRVKLGETTTDRLFHLQSVRCVGACSLAPIAVINGKTYGKCQPASTRAIISEWHQVLTTEVEVRHD